MADTQRYRSCLKLTWGTRINLSSKLKTMMLIFCHVSKQNSHRSVCPRKPRIYPAFSAAVRLQAEQPNADEEGNNSDGTPEPLRWLDIGTGSGLLASMVSASASPASSAGATPKSSTTRRTTAIEVYACEAVAEVADVAAETFDKNEGGVRLFRGRSTEMGVGKDLPSRVPRVISELLGTGQSVEAGCPVRVGVAGRMV